MLGALLPLVAIAQLVAVVTPAPTSTSTPATVSSLPEIAHTHSTPFCTVMRNNIAPSIAGLLVNDQDIAQAKPAYLKLGQDYALDPHDAAITIDQNRLELISGALVNNLKSVDNLLNDPAFTSPKDDQERKTLGLIKGELQAVEEQQRHSINVIEGFLDTYSMDSLNDLDNGLGGAINRDAIQMQTRSAFSGIQYKGFFTDTSMFQHTPNAEGQDPRFSSPTQFANNPFSQFALAIAVNEYQTQRIENQAASAVLTSSAGCK